VNHVLTKYLEVIKMGERTFNRALFNSNMAKLPEMCWAVQPSSNEVIMIKRGEMGYYPQREDVLPYEAHMVDALNERLGVTKEQEKAMVSGSMFGWDCPAADPDEWVERV
jgi:hypothetical protein